MENTYEKSPLLKVNASAGSGKTYTLTNNFVDLLFASDLAPCESCMPYEKSLHKKFNFSELLAITFTNLAANQMKEKVIGILKEYAFKTYQYRQGTSQEEKEEKSRQAHAMLEAVFRQYGALNIRTIDSLLNQLLGLFSLELGYAPNFETSFSSDELVEELYEKMAEESIATQLYAVSFQELCHNFFTANNSYDGFLAKKSIREHIQAFINYSIQNNEYFSDDIIAGMEQDFAFFQKEIEECEQELAESIQALNEKLLALKLEKNDNFSKALDKALKGDFSSVMWDKASVKEVLKGKKDNADKAENEFQDLKSLAARIQKLSPFVENYRKSVPVIKICQKLAHDLLEHEKRVQCINTQKMPYIIAALLGQENGDFDNDFLFRHKEEEMLLSAAYCRLGTRLGHILYDEFQDTSVAQWKALRDLSGEALANGGSVFFVGDIKQAIYGWRGGKASLFNDAPRELAQGSYAVGGEPLQHNWRSFENIIKWNNAFFENLRDKDLSAALSLLIPRSARKALPLDLVQHAMTALQEDYQTITQSVPAVRLEKVQGKGTVQVHMLRNAEKHYDMAVLALLSEMVRKLGARYQGDYSKIAVLTVTNRQASWVSEILLQHDIPVVSQGSLGLKEHPLIIELIAFMRFLANPLDDNAFCQTLFSRQLLPSAFSAKLPMPELYDFLVEIRQQSCFTVFKERYPHVWQEYFHALVDGENLLTAYDTLCEIYERMQVMENNPEAEVYLLRMKELAHLAEEQGIVDLNAFLAWWEKNGEKEKAPLPEGLNSVSVLTIHKSKGLEFDAVIIPYHNFKIDVTDDIHKICLPYEGKEYCFYAKLKKEYGYPYYGALLEKVKESINTHYVAWTRAKEELHIFMPKFYSVNEENQEETENPKKQAGKKKSSQKNSDEMQGAGYYYRFIHALLQETASNSRLADKNTAGEIPPKSVLTQNEDYWHFGEPLSEDILAEKSLRVLEYALMDKDWAVPAVTLEDLQEFVTEEEQKKISALVSAYTDEEDRQIRSLKIPSADVLYVAKALSRILCPMTAKDSQKAKDTKNSRTDTKKRVTPNPKTKPQKDTEHGMDWLPQLRIFRSDLGELQGKKDLSSNKRGTLIHKSLEYLVFSGNIAEDCKRASFEAMKFLPYGQLLQESPSQFGVQEHYLEKLQALNQEVQEILTWFAGLEEPFGGARLWFQHGYKEHGLVNENGDLFRVDLLVEIPEMLRSQYQDIAYIAVDYKTGYANENLPNPGNTAQIMNYMDLLTKATGKKAVGLLIYLDAKKCCLVEKG